MICKIKRKLHQFVHTFVLSSQNFCSTYKEVKLWFEIDWNGGSKMVLRLQVPKIVPKNETLVTKRHIEIPKGSGQKHFVLERSNRLKKTNQNLSQKMNSQITYGFFTFYYSSSRKKYSTNFPISLSTAKLRKMFM